MKSHIENLTVDDFFKYSIVVSCNVKRLRIFMYIMKKYDFPVENILHLNAFTPNTLKEEKSRIEFENTIKTPTLELYENFVKEYKLDFSNFSRNFD